MGHNNHHRFVSSLLPLLATTFVAACLVDFPTIRDAEQVCLPGENVFCRCQGGTPGTRTCDAAGAAFGECRTSEDTPCSDGEEPPDTLPPPGAPNTKDDGGGGTGGTGDGGAPPSNCGSVDYFGQCNGDQLSWCNQGHLVQTDCTASDRVCGLVDDTRGYDCVDRPDPCEGLTHVGECNAHVLRYCSSDQIVEIDCAAQGQICTYSDTLAYYDCV